jgi:hypothetical protein
MSDSTIYELPHELAHRAADGLDVALLWRRSAGMVTVSVSDRRSGDSFELLVPGDRALDAFNHPYAYRA